MFLARTKAAVNDILAVFSGGDHPELPRVLTYHAISSDRSDPYAVSPMLFRHHLELLAGLGLRGVSLRALMTRWPWADPGAIALTFDDATSCQLTHAVPALLERGFGCTLFVPSAIVSGTAKPIAKAHMSWDQVTQLAAVPGFEIGSHSRTHPSVGSISRQQAVDEIVGSKSELQDRLGRCVDSFAYPYGRRPAYNDFTRAAVAGAGYRWACTMTGGPLRGDCDLLELPRDGIQRFDSTRRLRWRISGRFDRVAMRARNPPVKKGLPSACVE